MISLYSSAIGALPSMIFSLLDRAEPLQMKRTSTKHASIREDHKHWKHLVRLEREEGVTTKGVFSLEETLASLKSLSKFNSISRKWPDSP